MRFCTRCGKQIEAGQVCGCSGSKGIASTSGHKPFRERAKLWPQSTKQALKIVSIIFGSIILLTIIGSAITAPINTASRYVRAKANGNWGRAYDCFPLGEHESDFINKNSFIAVNENTSITRYEISGESVFAEAFAMSPTLSCSAIYFTSAGSQEESINLIRKGSALLFFSSYSVSPDRHIVSDYQVTVPKGAAAYMDDIRLVPLTNTRNDYYDTFTIPRIFVGQHMLRVEHPVCDAHQERINIRGQGDSTHSIESLRLSAAAKADLAKKSEDLYNKIVSYAQKGFSFEDLHLPLTSDNYYSYYIDYYDQMVSALNRQEGMDGFLSFDATRYTDKSTQTELDIGNAYFCEIDIDYDYVWIEHDWQDNVIEGFQYPASSSTTISFTYVYENGDWAIRDMQLGDWWWWYP